MANKKSTLSEIIEVEKNARQRIAEAENYRREVLENAEKIKADIMAEGFEKAKDKAEKLKKQSELDIEKAIAELSQKTAKETAALQEKCNSSKKQWVAELYERALADEQGCNR